MELNERMHTYIAGLYYRKMIEAGMDDADKLFVQCVKAYGTERGQRMAKRAKRDGKPLDYNSYAAYREWNPSQQSIQENTTNLSSCTAVSPDYTVHYSRCPWAMAFQEMGEYDAAKLYCATIDEAVIHGFNPDLQFSVSGCLACDSECVQTWINGNVQLPFKAPEPSDQKGFDYHCAHMYWTFARVIEQHDAIKGPRVKEMVIEEFSRAFGKEAAEAVLGGKDTDYTTI